MCMFHNNNRYTILLRIHTCIYANIIIKRGHELEREGKGVKELEKKGWYENDVNNYV